MKKFDQGDFKFAIVVDAQEDFILATGALPVPGAEAMVPTINSYLENLTLENGYLGAMLRVAEMMEKRSRATYVTPWQIGTLYTRAGKKDKALDWLEKAFEAHDANVPYLSVDPLFDDLRSEPRFQDLLRRLNFPENENFN